MLLTLDYDQTYTRDPDFWDAVIALGPEHVKAERVPVPTIPAVCADDQFKAHAARTDGYQVSIWIDDMPGTISRSLELPCP